MLGWKQRVHRQSRHSSSIMAEQVARRPQSNICTAHQQLTCMHMCLDRFARLLNRTLNANSCLQELALHLQGTLHLWGKPCMRQ